MTGRHLALLVPKRTKNLYSMRATKLDEESGLMSVLVSVVPASYVQEWVWCLTTPPIFSACGQFKFKCIDWKCKLFLHRRGEQVGCESAFRMFVECGLAAWPSSVFMATLNSRKSTLQGRGRTDMGDGCGEEPKWKSPRAVASRQYEVTVRIAWKANHTQQHLCI